MTRLFVGLVIIILVSCGHRQDNMDAAMFYGNIHSILDADKKLQNKFFYGMKDVLRQLDYNNNVVVDTTEFHMLLDSLKQISQSQLRQVTGLTEVDTEINLKSKAVTYLSLENSICSRDFSEFIRLLGRKEDKKSYKAAVLLDKEITALSDAGLSLRDAEHKFATKYNIVFVDQTKR